jgi:hypothetical protein
MLVIIAAALIALVVTNPDREAHQQEIVKKFNEQYPISGKLKMGDILTDRLEYNSYLIFSQTRYKDHEISTGYLTKVYVKDIDLSVIFKEIYKDEKNKLSNEMGELFEIIRDKTK